MLTFLATLEVSAHCAGDLLNMTYNKVEKETSIKPNTYLLTYKNDIIK